jgi:glycosyltransferase involved in cell wall biosynthesis
VISAVVPAYNEEARIGDTVAALLSIPIVDEVIVVDDGSIDGTASSAAAAGARVERLSGNRGKGAAVEAGVSSAHGDILLLADADLGSTANQTAALLQPILTGEADMTIATFPVIPGRGGGMGFVVRLAREGILRATGQEMQAPLSGQRAMRREVVEKIGGFAPGYGMEVALTIDALRAGFRVMEIPTRMTHRVTGRDLHAIRHRIRQYLAVRAALRRRQ